MKRRVRVPVLARGLDEVPHVVRRAFRQQLDDERARGRLDDRAFNIGTGSATSGAGTPWEKETIDPEIYKRFVGLTKYGLEAYLCEITYKRLKIDPGKTRSEPFLKFVPSGVATVAELQGKGFAYLKVG